MGESQDLAQLQSLVSCKYTILHGLQLFLTYCVNRLMPNDPYRGRTAQLTFRRCILYIYSTNIRTEYFKHSAHSLFFPLQNAIYFITLPFLVLYYSHFIHRMCQNLKGNSGAKGLRKVNNI